jgi:hypothetical protein
LVDEFDWAMEKTPVAELYASGVVAENEVSEARPSDDVAMPMKVLPGPPMRSEEDAIEESPVPPPVTPSVPEIVGAKVKAPAELVMLSPIV